MFVVFAIITIRYYQVGVFYNKVLNEEEKFRLCDNIASHLCNAQPFIQVSRYPWLD